MLAIMPPIDPASTVLVIMIPKAYILHTTTILKVLTGTRNKYSSKCTANWSAQRIPCTVLPCNIHLHRPVKSPKNMAVKTSKVQGGIWSSLKTTEKGWLGDYFQVTAFYYFALLARTWEYPPTLVVSRSAVSPDKPLKQRLQQHLFTLVISYFLGVRVGKLPRRMHQVKVCTVPRRLP